MATNAENSWSAENSWGIEGTGPESVIVNRHLGKRIIEEEVYNYRRFRPLVLAPISKVSTLVLSEYYENNRLALKIHDIRMVDEVLTSSISFTLRGTDFRLKRLRSELRRSCDHDKCVGIMYLLRKIFYSGFSVIYAPKILQPKNNSTLEAARDIVIATMSGVTFDVDSTNQTNITTEDKP